MEAPRIVIHGTDDSGDLEGRPRTYSGGVASSKLPGKKSSSAAASSSTESAAPQSNIDKYTAGIELSNACRDFYVTRLKAAESMHRKLFLTREGEGGPQGRAAKHDEPREDFPVPVSSGSPTLDKAMVVLRKEMVSLMDQDLALMRQLLTLNEQIEEMKWRRKLGGYLNPAHYSQSTSSCFLQEGYSSSSVASSTSALGLPEPGLKYPSPSQLSLMNETGHFSTQESLLFADADTEDEEDPTTPTPGRACDQGFGKFSEGVVDRVAVSPSYFDREGSSSTRSTSDLGSSGEDSSVTDLTKGTEDEEVHNGTLTTEDSNHNVHNSQRYKTSPSGSDHDGYFSMEKEQCVRVGPVCMSSSSKNTGSNTKQTQNNSEDSSNNIKGDQQSTDSGIQDTDPGMMEMLI